MRFDTFDVRTATGEEIGRWEMSDARDPAIKLFGRTIPLQESQGTAVAGENLDLAPASEPAGDVEEICRGIVNTEAKDPISDVPEELDQGEPASSSGLNNSNEDDHQTSTQDDKPITESKPEQDQSEADEKVLKKPDKILPCPRCNSLDTKFCYYNNYNVNQPRHFCKKCQRYWTAGGTMRNVPVGAGRRKNKHSSAHIRQIMMSSDGMPCPQLEALDSAHGQALSGGLSAPMKPLKGIGTVLKFGPETAICESMTSVLDLRDQKKIDDMGSVPGGESREEPSCASSLSTSNFVGNGGQNGLHGCHSGFTPMHNLQCFLGPPWPYTWDPGWTSVTAMAAGRCSSELVHGPENGKVNLVPWSPPPMLTPPAFCAPTIPFPFVPASLWGCMSGWPNAAWNIPWLESNGGISPSSSRSNSVGSASGSPTLGKHSRDGQLEVGEKTERSLWVPKTLRIDDPDEAAKSSIWATLGIKPDESIKRGGMFKAFQSKTETPGHTSDSAQILHANPAALCRSQTFQEST